MFTEILQQIFLQNFSEKFFSTIFFDKIFLKHFLQNFLDFLVRNFWTTFLIEFFLTLTDFPTEFFSDGQNFLNILLSFYKNFFDRTLSDRIFLTISFGINLFKRFFWQFCFVNLKFFFQYNLFWHKLTKCLQNFFLMTAFFGIFDKNSPTNYFIEFFVKKNFFTNIFDRLFFYNLFLVDFFMFFYRNSFGKFLLNCIWQIFWRFLWQSFLWLFERSSLNNLFSTIFSGTNWQHWYKISFWLLTEFFDFLDRNSPTNFFKHFSKKKIDFLTEVLWHFFHFHFLKKFFDKLFHGIFPINNFWQIFLADHFFDKFLWQFTFGRFFWDFFCQNILENFFHCIFPTNIFAIFGLFDRNSLAIFSIHFFLTD